MKNYLFPILASLTVIVGCSSPVPERLQQIDTFVTRFNEYPSSVPTGAVPDAPLEGNGDLGITMAASPEMLRFYVGKNDFWRAYPDHRHGAGLALPGGLDIKAGIISNGKYSAEQFPGTAKLTASFADADNTLDIRSWVPATENLLVIELTATKQTELIVKLWSPNGYDSVNDGGNEEDITWVTRSLGEPPVVEFPTDIAMAINIPDSTVVLKPGKTETIVLAAYTNHDTDNWKQTALDKARSFSANVSSSKRTTALKDLEKSHLQWWNDFWNESKVEFDDKDLEYWYYSSQYLFACSSRSGKFAPGLWGPFITADYTGWNGDYHLNYNYQAPYWHCFSSNHISLTDNYDQPLLDFMPTGKMLAQTLTGCSGILYPVGISPLGTTCVRWVRDPSDPLYKNYKYFDPPLEGGFMFWGQKTDAAFAAANMLMRFYSTYDEEYAKKVYPFVSACADFYADFCKERDGRYVIMDDAFWEVMPWNENAIHNYNSITALGLAKMAFKGASAMSDFLGIDADKRARWTEIVSKLADYPTGYTEDGRLSFKYMQRLNEKGKDEDVPVTGLNRVIMHGLILPSGVVGQSLDPKIDSIMLSDLQQWKGNEKSDWGHSMDNGFETVYAGAVRAGFPAAEVLKHMRERIPMFCNPNGWIEQYGGGIETLAGVPLTINEMLLQSYEGIVRIFPDWDRSINASYENLRAYGAFLVSSSIKDGKVGDVKIHSEKGRTCTLQNPWPGSEMKIVRNGKPEDSLSGDIVNIATSAGDEIVVSQVIE